MRILITGANGFLGSCLTQKLIKRKYQVIATGKGDCRLSITNNPQFIFEEMDFTNMEEVDFVIGKHQPSFIVHGGAMSKPDECELNQEQAYKVNVDGTLNLLNAATKNKSFFVFISTDFVFDGTSLKYVEEDALNPVNYYGFTKKMAEEKVNHYPNDWSIIRTILVYGKPNSGRNNLLTIVKEKLENGETYSVFNDQLRMPTYVEDLADGIIAVIEKRATGIFHLSGTDVFSPFEMACKTSELLDLDKNLIKKITEKDMKQAAKRPPITGFNIDKAKRVLGYNPISFEDGIKKTFLFKNEN